jgi:hypothetical protein
VDDKTPLPRTNFEWMPPGALSRLETDQVLIPELSEQILNRIRGMRGRARNAHVPASPAREIFERGGLCGAAVTDDLEFRAGMIERRNHSQQVHRNVD